MREMFSATAFHIRDAVAADVPELVRLGWAGEDEWPRGRILVGEIGGVVGAALAVEENRAVVADLHGAARLLAHIRARAAGMDASRRTPAVALRIRERIDGGRRPDVWALVAALPAGYG
jgi:hypothetical protein